MAFVGALAISTVVVLAGLAITSAVYEDENESTARGVGIEEILQHRAKYLGQRVTIRAPIDEVLGPKAFTVASPDDDLRSMLVVTEKPLEAEKPGWVSDEAVVEVEGVIHARDLREIEWGVEGLPDWAVERGKDAPALFAEMVRVVKREKPVSVGQTAQELTKRPTEFFGQLVTVAGEAGRVINDRAFILEPGLLIVGRLNALAGVEKGEYVEVTGEFERYSSFEKLNRKLDGRLTDQDLRQFVGRPLVIARAVNLALPAGAVSRGVDEESLE